MSKELPGGLPHLYSQGVWGPGLVIRGWPGVSGAAFLGMLQEEHADINFSDFWDPFFNDFS